MADERHRVGLCFHAVHLAGSGMMTMDGGKGIFVFGLIVVLCVVVGMFVFIASGADKKAAEMADKGASQ
jgi:uncharacterized membrane protein